MIIIFSHFKLKARLLIWDLTKNDSIWSVVTKYKVATIEIRYDTLFIIIKKNDATNLKLKSNKLMFEKLSDEMKQYYVI